MNEHPIQDLMKTTMENLKQMIDVNTIVGDAVETTDGTVIIPISKVSVGFAAGGGEYNINNKEKREEKAAEFPFGGGSGAGVSVQPVAFLVVSDNNVRLLPVNYNTIVDRIVDVVPGIVSKIEKKINKNKEKIDQNEKEDYIN